MKMLGGWVGGEDNASSDASRLFKDVADLLEERVKTLEHPKLTLQMRLLILRLCFFPVLVHLLRTQHPDIGDVDTARFDETVWTALETWVADRYVCDEAQAISQLPQRMGGLGLFSQNKLHAVGFGTGFALSQGVLLKRGMGVTASLYLKMSEFTTLCANNLNLPESEFLTEEWDKRHLQRRCMELVHERAWKEVFDGLSDPVRARLVESCSPLARGWMKVIPSDDGFSTMTDDQVRYALRRQLLSEFKELATAQGNCAQTGCDGRHHPMHHVTCEPFQYIRTGRHTSILNAVHSRMVWLGMARGANGTADHSKEVEHSRKDNVSGTIRTDIMAVLVGADVDHIDIGVTSMGLKSHVSWPSSASVQRAVALDAERGPAVDPLFFWEDHSSEKPHPEVVSARKFRSLASNECVGPAMEAMHCDKEAKYKKGLHVDVQTFILTAGGGVHKNAHEIIRRMIRKSGYDRRDVGVQSAFRTDFVGDLSIRLVRSSELLLRRNFSLHRSTGC